MVRVIGDIHGDFKIYQDLIKDISHSIQVGDFGFEDAWNTLKEVDSNYHKIIPGNHDNYDYINLNKPPHILGNFGEAILDQLKFFFVRGGDSIDKKWRVIGRSWWKDEQLSYKQLQEAIDFYTICKPEIVITRTFPEVTFFELFPKLWQVIPSITGNSLSTMLEIHKPKLWIFGHMHPEKNIIKRIGETTFIVLKEFGYIDYNPSFSIEENIQSFT
jgi:Icc-related predicted phosphoesterase